MASMPDTVLGVSPLSTYLNRLSDPRFAIAGPRFDALCFWAIPVIALVVTQLLFQIAASLPAPAGTGMAGGIIVTAAVVTYAHLFAVMPRAYLNREVFEQNRVKLTVVPIVLIAGLLTSPFLLAVGGTVAILWDVHHSAMQNFGLARIYDMKAGNDAQLLRRADMRLAWMLYVGPLAAGAVLMTHLHAFDRLGEVGLSQLAALPGVLEGHLSAISVIAIAAWAAAIGWAVIDYRRAMAAGYRMPAHKAALIGSTGLVSLLAWGFSSPVVALIAINIYHSIQYFALVWLKEGARMTAFAKVTPRHALLIFFGICLLVGLGYQLTSEASAKWLIAPFLACSLLHFWYDSFVWSVRKKQV